jgi:acetylglutamate kinase
MKTVIQSVIDITSDYNCMKVLAESVAQLCRDGHQIVIVQSSRRNENTSTVPLNHCVLGEPLNDIEVALIGVENRLLAGHLETLGVRSMGLCGSDVGILHLRKRDDHRVAGRDVVEASRVDPRRLEIICGNGGVPVISNLGMGAWGKYYLISPGEMASLCATTWRADGLIFLTEGNGIIDATGTVVRWLEMDQIEQLAGDPCQDAAMLARLKACRQALEQGIHRARILPISRAELLSSFYCEKIEVGTEVIMSASA